MNSEFIKRFFSSIVILPIVLFCIKSGATIFSSFLIFLFLLTSYEWIKMNNKKFINKILGIFFLIFSFFSAFQLRELYGINFFVQVVLICVFTDLGGYFFGKFFKGPKLTKISPKKTYAGVLGSFILPIIICLIFTNYINLNYIEILNFNVLYSILIISLISQLGDLVISYFKRVAKVKDTGKIIPGHGGVLDRIDGLIFVIPILNLLKTL